VAVEPVAAASEQRVVVENGVYRAELSNRGGRLLSFVLKDHRSRDGGLVDLVRERPADALYPFSLVDPRGRSLPLNEALFAVEEGREGGDRNVTFRYGGPAGAAEKRFVFREAGRFDVALDISQPARWALFTGPGLRNPTAAELEDRYERRYGVWLRGGEVEEVDPRKEDARVVLPGSGLGWVALSDQYFLTAVIPRGPVAGAVLAPYLMRPAADGAWAFEPIVEEVPEELEDLPRELAVILEPADGTMELTAYWGAKSYRRLAELPYGLERTINFGIFGFLSRWLLLGLLWIHDHVVHNYGWAIVLMTAIIKVVLLPLNLKAMGSAQKMRELQPQMTAVRAKWRGKLRDKQGKMNFEAQRKMNEEMRELYSTAGVNPAGGCLPMLLQMPVLFAFYYLLIAAVELRGAEWTLWIHDLSVRDPYYVLPLVMGATQFIQQKLTPMAGDPMQRRMMMMMPFVFTIFFLGFPSGLVLYWLTNNVLQIVQQGVYNRLQSPVSDPEEKAEQRPKGKRAK
jgi:YidC/Oxa1 family membrane protein insertase